MNRHITSEVLSAYLDYEVELPVRRNVERHLESCEKCRTHLVSMQRVVRGLSRVERVAPPLPLAAQIRRQAEAQASLGLWARCKELFLELPRRSEMRTHVAMAMALVVSVFLVGHGIERRHLEQLALGQEPNFEVSVDEGVSDGAWSPGTSEVAGREWLWEDVDRIFVEKGFRNGPTVAHIYKGSPEGQALLRSNRDLDNLFGEGVRAVRFRDGQTFVELSTSHS
jgi:hypothetical protein